MIRAFVLFLALLPAAADAAGGNASRPNTDPVDAPGADGQPYSVQRPGSYVTFSPEILEQMRIAILKKRGQYRAEDTQTPKKGSGH